MRPDGNRGTETRFASLVSVVLAASLWGSLGIFARFLYQYGLTPAGVATAKTLVATAGLFTIALLIKPSMLIVDRRVLPLLAVNGLVSVSLLNWLYFETVFLAGAGIAALLLYTAPVFVALLSRLFLKQTLSRKKILALVLVITGLSFLTGAPTTAANRIPRAALATGLLSGLAWALYSLFTKPLLKKIPNLTLLFYLFGFGFLFLFLFQPQTLLGIHLPARGWLLLICLGLIPTAGAYLLYNRGLRRLDPAVASIIATIEPVSAIVQEFFFFGRALDRPEVAGAALILLGAVVSQLPGRTMGEGV